MSDQAGDPKLKVFFPNLDALRFISFLLVFGFHIYKTIYSKYSTDGTEMPALLNVLKAVFQNGYLGVNLFFVLSGFLITYLLIRENETRGRINVGKFYMRRILRTWPLFYLSVFFGFVVFPYIAAPLGVTQAETANPLYYLFFLNNFDMINAGPPNALILAILWSVAVEEQFYLFWPLFMRIFRLKHLKYLCISIIIGSIAFRILNYNDQFALYFHTFAVIGDIAFGGLLAYFTSHDNKFRSLIVRLPRAYIIALYSGAIGLLLFRQYIFISPALVIFERMILALFFGFIILEQNFSERSLFKLSNLKLVTRLGVYSYGLYCLHFIGIYLAFLFVDQFSFNQSTGSIFVLKPMLSLAITLLLSILSYHYFEKRFLAYKGRFGIVVKE
jgi:peptidoglycan/LPS O-acetylase OafA/YrhL